MSLTFRVVILFFQINNLFGIKLSRFLNVFHVVNFDNGVCTSSNNLEGVCLHIYECLQKGGSAMGECGNGYGVCCIMTATCGDVSSLETLWFINPRYPSPEENKLSCTMTIQKSSNVVQLLVNFLYLEIHPPNDGTCDTDQFIITGHNKNSIIPTLCGINNGQHIYIEVSETKDPIQLTIHTESEGSRSFAIQIKQLKSNNHLVAPYGCLQYYTDNNNFIESFNYKNEGNVLTNTLPTYFNNLNYAVCIRRGTNMCSITYSNLGVFQIFNYDRDGYPTVPDGQAGVEIFNCPSDYISIASIRFCGERLNDASTVPDFTYDAPVVDTSAGPIVLYVRTDSLNVGRGFHINYVQNQCENDSNADPRS